ncbi:competence protein [Aeribacillus sp. FSL M8-0235]
MGKRNKSKRFIEQGAVKKHDEKFPYRMTFAESEARVNNEASFEG